MDDYAELPSSRRGFLKHAAAGGGMALAALAAGCARQQRAASGDGRGKRLRAAFSNGGLTTTWCKLGHDTAMLWGELLDVEVVWVDGELNPQKQREKSRREMLGRLKKRDTVTTIGGIHGQVVELTEDTVTLRIDAAKDVKVKMQRSAIGALIKSSDAAAGDEGSGSGAAPTG